MEEITVEKIKARIRENLKKVRRHNFVANTNEEISKPITEPRIVAGLQSIAKKIIVRGLQHKHVIKKIPILNTIARKFYFSLTYSRTQNPTLADRNAKKLIRRIPFFGYLLWYIYTILKTPGKINQLFALADEQKVKDDIITTKMSQLFSEINELRSKVEASETKINKPFVMSENKKVILPAVLITEGYIGDSRKAELLHNDAMAYEVHDRNYADTFYYSLENIFRGSIEDIKNRQSIYLPYVTEAHTNSQGKYFLDAGCGRGEFLSLLQDSDIPAKGVDINRITTDLARRKFCVDVILSDALEYLNDLEDNSLIGVSMFQVIEHLDFKYINTILETVRKKIALNGIIMLESVNPHCPIAFGSFYLDPFHNRPYPPDLLEFMLLWHDFGNIKIIYSSPAPDAHFKQASMNYQTYAAVGKRLRP